jgi:quinolinate synthase
VPPHECPPHIVDHADYVGSTSGILAYAKETPAQTLIVATEPHIIHQMQLAMPNKTFINNAPGTDGLATTAVCLRRSTRWKNSVSHCAT